jgi:hypothetical protein
VAASASAAPVKVLEKCPEIKKWIRTPSETEGR